MEGVHDAIASIEYTRLGPVAEPKGNMPLSPQKRRICLRRHRRIVLEILYTRLVLNKLSVVESCITLIIRWVMALVASVVHPEGLEKSLLAHLDLQDSCTPLLAGEYEDMHSILAGTRSCPAAASSSCFTDGSNSFTGMPACSVMQP